MKTLLVAPVYDRRVRGINIFAAHRAALQPTFAGFHIDSKARRYGYPGNQAMSKNRFVNQKLGKRTSRRLDLLRAGIETVAKSKRAGALKPRSEKFFSPKRQPAKP